MKFIFFLSLLLSTQSFANTETFFYDDQKELKEAFERAQAAHNLKEMSSTFSRPTMIKKEKTTDSKSSANAQVSKKYKSVKEYIADASSLVEKAPEYLYREVLQKYGISDFAKRMWRAARGIKSTPPTLVAFTPLFNTGGVTPEVLWVAQGATDPDGTVDRYEFTFGDGKVQIIPYADFDHTNQVVFHIYPTTGTYNASVKIVDNTGDFTVYNASVTVTNTNSMPVPKFTVQTNQVPNFLKADFTSQATDSDGTFIRYLWGFGDGSADNVGTTNTSVSRTYTNPGTYNVRFQVRDNLRAQITATTQIYVGVTPPAGGMPPVPIVRADRLAGLAPMTVNFDGESSFDIDGTIASYEWNFGEYNSPLNYSKESKPRYKYTQPGTYYGSLTTKDNGGRTAVRYFAAYVLPSVLPTDLDILAFPQQQARTFLFETSFKNLKTGVQSSYIIWDFGDGSPRQKKNYPTYTYANNGTYTVTMKVYDVRGGVHTTTKQIVVNSDMSAPPSYFISSAMNTTTNTSINFITQNQHLVSPTTTAIWDFGDGNVQSDFHEDLLSVSHSFTQAGVYPVSLRVTDANGKSSQYFNYVVVQGSSAPVQAIIEASDKIGPVPFPVRLDAGYSSSSAGSIDKYQWSMSAPGGSLYHQGEVWTPIFETGGEKVIRLFVTDSAGNVGSAYEFLSAIDDGQIPPSNEAPTPIINISFNDNNPGSFKFDAYASSDPEGDRIIDYEWNLDGTKIDGFREANYYIAQEGGTHTISLKVTDRWGASRETKRSFTRSSTTNQIISYLRTPDRPVINAKVYFLANEQTIHIPGAVPVEYNWDFGDGNTDCCSNRVNHTYSTAGTYAAKLTVKDSNNQTHVYSQNIVVESPTAPTVVITAKDVTGTIEYFGNQTYTIDEFPTTINFDLVERSSAQGQLKDATWDFGDGNSGFGLSPEYSYQKPGNYTVQVTAIDEQGLSNTTSMDVVIGSSYCSDTDGIEGCLSLNSTLGSVFPMSYTEWNIGHDAEPQDWNPDPSDTDYIQLVSVDENPEVVYNITSATFLDGDLLRIQKSGLQTLGVNFSRPYKIIVQTTLEDTTEYGGMFPKIQFGIGTLNITANETGIRLKVTGPEGYKKYISLGGNTTHQMTNLPVGSYSVVAEKGNRSLGYSFTITNSTPQSLTIDLSEAMIRKNAEYWKKEAARRKKLWGKDSYVQRILKGDSAAKEKAPKNYPWWSYDACGKHAPNRLGTDRPPAQVGREYTYHFGTWLPESKEMSFNVNRGFGTKMKLSCSVVANANHYQVSSWVNETGPVRCSNAPGPNSYWIDTYQPLIQTEINRGIKVKYHLTDVVSGKVVENSKSFTLKSLMSDHGVTLRSITDRVGIAYRNDIDHWGLNFDWDVEIPKDFKLPKAKFNIEGHYEQTNGVTTYNIVCNFDVVTKNNPKVDLVKVSTTGLSAKSELPIHSKRYNGLRFATNKFFPIGVADATMDNYTSLSDIYEAQVEVKFDKGNYSSLDFTDVKVSIMRDGVEKGWEIYDFVPGSIQDDSYLNEKFKADVIIDARDFAADIPFEPGNTSSLSFKFTPRINGVAENEMGAYSVSNVIPLFNAKKINQDSSGTVCSNGFYNDNRTIAYGQTKLINELIKLTATPNNLEFRCNDMSLPWGGKYFVKGNTGGHIDFQGNIAHSGHDKGLNADIRYFNTSGQQDSYDSLNPAFKRLSDLNSYLVFSAWAKFVADAIVTDPVKESVYLLCMDNIASGGPCTENTLAGDMTHEMILKTCQWYDSAYSVCNPLPPPAISTWREAIQRYSTWAEKNMGSFIKIKQTALRAFMAGGSRTNIFTAPSNLSIYNRNWQRVAINEGLWPDGSTIYKAGLSNIHKIGISNCGSSGCGLQIYFDDDQPGHFDHSHLTIN